MARMLEQSYDPMGYLRRREEEEAQYDWERDFLIANANDALEYTDDDALIKELRFRGYKVEEGGAA